MTCAQNTTIRANYQHHVLTRSVCNRNMKTVGERIRQAREYRKMSGEELARRAGYKHQSGIGNLENRATGTGGHKIVEIARALDFAVHWFLNGPDTDDMGSVLPFEAPPTISDHRNAVKESTPGPLTLLRPSEFPAWPFREVSPGEYFTLSKHQRTMVEGFIRGLIHDNDNTKACRTDKTMAHERRSAVVFEFPCGRVITPGGRA